MWELSRFECWQISAGHDEDMTIESMVALGTVCALASVGIGYLLLKCARDVVIYYCQHREPYLPI